MGVVFKIDADDLRAALHACALAMAKHADRPDLSEVFVERKIVDKVRFVATDGRRLHAVTVAALWDPDHPGTAVRFPADAVRLLPGVLQRALNSLPETCLHGDEERVACVSIGNVALPNGEGLSYHPSGFADVPDVARIVNALRSGASEPPLDPRQLADAAMAAIRVREGKKDFLRFCPGEGDTDPSALTMSTAHREFLAVVMPIVPLSA